MAIYNVKKICHNHYFSAASANNLFDQICLDIIMIAIDETIYLDMKDVEVVSTSFAGRFRERLQEIKHQRTDLKFKMRNVKPPIADFFKETRE